ncbi:rho GTPase-activating protein 45-like [Oppia nitens]|uniref:rho GTPase-activating protein 45-like n=1 Tax=Oppia nitens TaxID=1686743 RepID=UPI0023DAB299|nr:rho GTPase-activating protein 45-like [Oppia nitens]
MASIPIAMSEVSISSASSSADSELSTREDISALTDCVKQLRESLAKIKRVFNVNQERDKKETLRVAAHERLGEVLKAMRQILEKYPKLQSTDLLMSAGNLIHHVKNFNYDDRSADNKPFIEAVDQLALAFSTRVSEYLMGDIDVSTIPSFKSTENLVTDSSSPSAVLSANDIDDRFLALPEGIDLALHRAKVWSKYTKDVISYIEKRTNIEADHARNLIKHAHQMKSIIKEESFLPFQSIYLTAIDQDVENGNSSLATCSLLLGHKFVEPMNTRRVEHEKTRKQIKELWTRELKRMHEAVNTLRKARALYVTRQQELEKAKTGLRTSSESGTEWSVEKMDKKRRAEEDASVRAREAELAYKTSVQEANYRAAQLQKVKKDLLVRVRELLSVCEGTMKTATSAYFQLCHVVSAPLPVQLQNLVDSVRNYDMGSAHMDFVKRLPEPQANQTAFTFQPHVTTDHDSSESDSNSSSPANSPPTRGPSVGGGMFSSGDELETDHDFNTDSGYFPSNNRPKSSTGALLSSALMSKAAETHKFRKLKTPSRCRECDSYVYFQGLECLECGLGSHKKCLETLTIQCGHVKLPRRMTTFGVALSAQSDNSEVPLIVKKCIEEIDERGSTIKGIYRVSGVKSRVEKLCQSFESGQNLVDLSSTPPNVIANVLKLYLRQLPEPLMTYRLYPEFIHIAKSFPSSETHETSDEEEQEIVAELKQAVSRLSKVYFNTLSYLMNHLKRVSELSHENNMPSSNLGIVFGPTLLRTSDGDASLSSLVDTVHQSRLIELLITYATEVFGSGDEQQDMDLLIENSPKQSKVFKSATCVTISGQKVVTSNNNNNNNNNTLNNNNNVNSKQNLTEARRQFFTSPASPPQYRTQTTLGSTNGSTVTTNSSTISPFSQSIASSPTPHPKLRRTSSSQQSSSVSVGGGTIGPATAVPNELARSASHAFTTHTFTARNAHPSRQYKYV